MNGSYNQMICFTGDDNGFPFVPYSTQVSEPVQILLPLTALRVMSQPDIGNLAEYRTTMTNIPDNVVQFPLSRRRDLRTCPHCGTHSDVWQIGRLLWGYCDVHEVRWVVADYHDIAPEAIDRTKLRKGLEFLSSFAEVSR